MKRILCFMLAILFVMPLSTALAETNTKLQIITVNDSNGNGVIEQSEIVNAASSYEGVTLASFYDESNRLIACSYIDNDKFSVPNGTKLAKVYVWGTAKVVVKEEPKDDQTIKPAVFGGDNGQITVGFFGASTTQMGHYTKIIEHYYHTRYPNKDIVFVNKAIPGNSLGSFINRFEWDITGDELSGKIDEAIITFGFNDSSPIYYVEGEKYSREKQDQNIALYAQNLEKVINLCEEANIKLTIMSPQLFDPHVENCTSQYPDSVNTYGLSKMTKHAEEIAKKYNLPYIDIWTPLTETTTKIREEYGVKGPIVVSTDGIHPGEQGGFYMAYVILKAQEGGSSFVAKVNVDVANSTMSAQNASVKLTKADKTRVEYEYLPNALPLAYNGNYKQFEEWGIPVTEEMNLETIKVTGLEDGQYQISIGGNVLSNTYTSSQLAEGVNISIDTKNPAQMQALQSYMNAISKASYESKYRGIATTEQAIKSHPEVDVSQFNENSTEDELKVLGTAYISMYKSYFSNSPTEYGAKKYEVENWNKIREREQKIKDMSKPVQRTVVIEKIK